MTVVTPPTRRSALLPGRLVLLRHGESTAEAAGTAVAAACRIAREGGT